MEYIILTKEEISKKMLNIFGYIIVFCIQNYSPTYIHIHKKHRAILMLIAVIESYSLNSPFY